MPFYGYGFYFDPTYILVIIGALICLAASARVKLTFRKYNRVRSMSGMTGAQAAERILRAAGIHDVSIEHVSGDLTDHYDPRRKVLRLSDSTYGSASVAAVGVTIRGAIVPVANFGSAAAWPLIIIGMFISSNTGTLLIDIGIICFSLAVMFQLVTLPVEFNASRRAVRILGETGILDSQELRSTRKVLGAAALTYVAGAAAAILQLLRLVLLFGGRNDD